MNENRKKRGNVGMGNAPQMTAGQISRGQFLKTAGIGAAAIGAAALGLGGVANAVTTGASPTVLLSGTTNEVRIYRDGYGVPYVYSNTDYGLFYGLGYSQGQDRLWQFHGFRMAGQGRLSELQGAGTVNPSTGVPRNIETDIGLRLYYTQPNNLLLGHFSQLSQKFQNAMLAWKDGINAYISLVNQTPSLAPIEFWDFTNPQQPIPPSPIPLFTTVDIMGFSSYMSVSNCIVRNQQLENLNFLYALLNKPNLPVDQALALFDDTIWFDDPEAPVSVPSVQGKAYNKQLQALPVEMPDLSSATFFAPVSEDDMDKRLEEAGVSVKLGSMGLAISQSRSDDHRPLFGGGFQLGYNSVPPTSSEAQLTGGESGYDIRGAYILMVPMAGRKQHFNYTSMVGLGANNDWYLETISKGGPTGFKYRFNGIDVPFTPVGFVDPQNPLPNEIILVWKNGSNYEYSGDFGQTWKKCNVYSLLAPLIKSYPYYNALPAYWMFNAKGSDPLVYPLLKSIHGPLMGASIAPGATSGTGFTIKRVAYGAEYKHAQMFFDFGLAKTFDEFSAAVAKDDQNQHLCYTGFRYLTDGKGTDPIIAYFFTGEFPDRKAPGTVPIIVPGVSGGDPRLPRLGTGEDEWISVTNPHIMSINPSTGFLANWNNKPTADFQYGCSNTSYWNKAHRVHRIQREVMQRLQSTGKLTTGNDANTSGDIENIIKAIGSNYVNSFSSHDAFYYMRPYLLMISPEVGSQEAQALDIIRNWDLNTFDPPSLPTFNPNNGWTQANWATENEDPGYVIFKKWADLMHDYLFPDIAALVTYQASFPKVYNSTEKYGRVLHVLDYYMTGYSGVPPQGTYFNNVNPVDIMKEKLTKALEVLDGEGYPLGENKPRETVVFTSSLSLLNPLAHGFVGNAEWITYCQIANYKTNLFKNRYVGGQSGLIKLTLTGIKPDPNMFSQMDLTFGFGYKLNALLPESMF